MTRSDIVLKILRASGYPGSHLLITRLFYSVVKYIRNISSMLNHFVVMGIIKDNPFKMYSEKLIEVDAVYLTQDELKKIEDKVFENKTVKRLLYILSICFCCSLIASISKGIILSYLTE